MIKAAMRMLVSILAVMGAVPVVAFVAVAYVWAGIVGLAFTGRWQPFSDAPPGKSDRVNATGEKG